MTSFRPYCRTAASSTRLAAVLSLVTACSPPPAPAAAATDADIYRPTGAGDALRFRYRRRLDAAGTMPADGLMRAKTQRDAMVAEQVRLDEAGITRSGWRWLGPHNFAGRIRALLPHPTQPNVLWVGAASGGIWKSTDAGATWRPLDDFLASLAVACLAMDPTDPDVLYAGTGEGYLNADAVQGAGIFRSTDGGGTWSRLPATDPLTGLQWLYVNRLAIDPTDPQVILAATWLGIYRTTDGGANWSQRTMVRALDVEFHPFNGSRAVAAQGDLLAGNHRVIYSGDGGASWMAATGLPIGDTDRIEVAYAPAAPDFVFASVTRYDATAMPPTPKFSTHGLFRSGDGGQTFLPWNIVTNYLSTQGWYNNAVWVEPTDASAMNVVVGGLDLWRSSGVGTNLVAISDFRRGTVPGDSPHADQHAIAHRAGYNGTNNRVVFVANDGGIQVSFDIMRQAATGWTSLNNGLGITQFYGAAVNNTSGAILAGNQDNHTLQHPGTGFHWTAINVDNLYSDGGFCAVASGSPGIFFGERQFLNVFRSTDGGLTGQQITSGLTDAGKAETPFITPLILDPNDPDRLLGGAFRLWRCSNARAGTPTWAEMRPAIPHRRGAPRPPPPVTAVVVAEGDADLVLVGYGDGQIWKSTDATAAVPTWTRVDGLMPELTCTRLAVDRIDHDVVWATFSGFTRSTVWRSVNGGTTWVVRTGAGARQLPEIPVSAIALHRVEPDWLYVGTDLGVFASSDAGATWSAATDGPANVVVDELVWRGDYTLVAVTHGRGIFEADVGPERVPVPGRTIRASVSSSGAGGDNQSVFPSLSADGRYVAFTSGATNLVPNDTGNWNDIFVHDRLLRLTTRVSVPTAGSQFNQANGHSNYSSISGDGRLVAFDSGASNLVRGDANGATGDVFVHDRVTRATSYASVSSTGQQGNGSSGTPSISPNGRYVAFASRATNLVPNDTNLKTDIFLHDRLTGRTVRVSVSSAGVQADGDCSLPAVADNGAVAFLSSAINLVTPDVNLSVVDVFVHDPNTGTTIRVNESSAGVQADRPGFDGPRISADGGFVVFDSLSAILVGGDSNGVPDVFWRDIAMGVTRRVSVSSGGQQGNGFSRQGSISASGRFVTFESAASNLVPGDTNGRNDVFVHDTMTGMTARVSVSSTGQEGDRDSGRVPGSTGLYSSAVSADGRITAFSSVATNLVPNDTNGRGDIFVHDAFPVVATSDTARPGATVRIAIHAPDDPNRSYVAAASLGTVPGIPVDVRVIPLNADSLFFMSLDTPVIFQDFVGMLDGDGKATATINLPPFSFLIGLRFFVASFTVRPGAPSAIGTISLPLPILVVP